MSDSISERHRDLIAGYARKTLTPEEMLAVEALLVEYPALQVELDRYRSVMAQLAEAVPPTKAPAHLRSQIMAAIAAPPPNSVVIAPVNEARSGNSLRRRGQWYPLAAAAAALLAIALGLDNYRLRQQVSEVQAKVDHLTHAEAEHEEYYSFRLKGKADNAQSMGLVAVNLEDGKIELALSDLPPLNEGEAYHLWAFTKDQQKILCGRFSPASNGTVNEAIAVKAQDYPSDIVFMRVSREPAVTPPDPTRRVLVMTSEM